jgi:hypothetical protein
MRAGEATKRFGYPLSAMRQSGMDSMQRTTRGRRRGGRRGLWPSGATQARPAGCPRTGRRPSSAHRGCIHLRPSAIGLPVCISKPRRCIDSGSAGSRKGSRRARRRTDLTGRKRRSSATSRSSVGCVSPAASLVRFGPGECVPLVFSARLGYSPARRARPAVRPQAPWSQGFARHHGPLGDK